MNSLHSKIFYIGSDRQSDKLATISAIGKPLKQPLSQGHATGSRLFQKRKNKPWGTYPDMRTLSDKIYICTRWSLVGKNVQAIYLFIYYVYFEPSTHRNFFFLKKIIFHFIRGFTFTFQFNVENHPFPDFSVTSNQTNRIIFIFIYFFYFFLIIVPEIGDPSFFEDEKVAVDLRVELIQITKKRLELFPRWAWMRVRAK